MRFYLNGVWYPWRLIYTNGLIDIQNCYHHNTGYITYMPNWDMVRALSWVPVLIVDGQFLISFKIRLHSTTGEYQLNPEGASRFICTTYSSGVDEPTVSLDPDTHQITVTYNFNWYTTVSILQFRG